MVRRPPPPDFRKTHAKDAPPPGVGYDEIDVPHDKAPPRQVHAAPKQVYAAEPHAAEADMIVGVDINPKREDLAKNFGMTHFVNPNEVEGDLVPYLVDLTKGGADYSFECIGNVDVMRQALECCHKGWGESIIIGVAGAGQEIATRPFQLVTGRVWKGTAFGGARGRTDVPKIVDWYMEGKINIDDLITHQMPLEDINNAFDLMHSGESIRSVVNF